jgi:hypothetical protein
MKKSLVFILGLLSVAFVSSAQVTKKTLELAEFKSIYVNSNYTVYLKQTNKAGSHRGSTQLIFMQLTM